MYLTKSLAVLLVCLTSGSYFGKQNFAFELLTHFKAHYGVLFLVCATVFLIYWRPTWFALSLGGAIVNAAHILPWYISNAKAESSDSGYSIKVLVSNVGTRRASFEQLSRLIDAEQPDIVGLIEVQSPILARLATEHEEFIHRIEYPQDNSNEGLALYSRFPVSGSKLVRFDKTSKPTIVADIDTGSAALEVILAHPIWPMGANLSARRNIQLQKMAEHVRSSEKAVLVAGDLNVTIWSPYYRDFVSHSGLVDSREGYGIGATFPAAAPALGIPIDYILATNPVRFRNFKVHDSIGSDHLPISVQVKLVPKTFNQKL